MNCYNIDKRYIASKKLMSIYMFLSKVFSMLKKVNNPPLVEVGACKSLID